MVKFKDLWSKEDTKKNGIMHLWEKEDFKKEVIYGNLNFQISLKPLKQKKQSWWRWNMLKYFLWKTEMEGVGE